MVKKTSDKSQNHHSIYIKTLKKILPRLDLNKLFKSLYETVFNRILLIRWDTLPIYTITQNIIGYGYRLFL
jgi:hypothetical protein